MKDLIPTFNIGEKVILNYHPYEKYCPNCGRALTLEREPFRAETVIAGIATCGECDCGFLIDNLEGFYIVNIESVYDENKLLAVPYTLLEKIPVSTP